MKATTIRQLLVISTILVVARFSLSTTTKTSEGKCQVLALAGGGDHGAYQAGVIKGLADNLPEAERKWDIITGISAGTLNGAGLSLFPEGKEREAGAFLEEVWRSITSSDKIYKNWNHLGKLGPVYALFAKSGIFDTTPLRELLTSIIKGKPIQRHLHVGVSQVESGDYEVYEADTLSEEDLINVLLSSASIPVLFPTVDFRGKRYQDGGVSHGTDLLSGINECKSKGFAEEDIIVDVAMCFPRNFKEKLPTKFTAIDSMLRWFGLWQKDRGERDIEDIINNLPAVNFRYVVFPSKDLPEEIAPIFFKPEDLEIMFAVGEEDAKNAIVSFANNGESLAVREIVDRVRGDRVKTKRAVPNEGVVVDGKMESDSIDYESIKEVLIKFLE